MSRSVAAGPGFVKGLTSLLFYYTVSGWVWQGQKRHNICKLRYVSPPGPAYGAARGGPAARRPGGKKRRRPGQSVRQAHGSPGVQSVWVFSLMNLLGDILYLVLNALEK